jgi:hypothetical protein
MSSRDRETVGSRSSGGLVGHEAPVRVYRLRGRSSAVAPALPLIALIDHFFMNERGRTPLLTGIRRIRVSATFIHRRSIGQRDIPGAGARDRASP